MRGAIALFSLSLSASASLLPNPQSIFTNPRTSEWKIPTIKESAVQARRILRLENMATISTVFPAESSSDWPEALEGRPHGLGGVPIGLSEYYADCEERGNPTILAVDIATYVKNANAGSNVSMSVRWHPQDGKWRSPANLPRFSLLGHLEDITDEEVIKRMMKCYSKSHPDATAWFPGSDIHASHWSRLVVDGIFWFGGFGDRSQITWIPMDTYNSVTEEEIHNIRLPGERRRNGWFEW